MRVRKAVIPAAGWGTRLLPATKAQPKEMLPIVDTPVIQYVVAEALASGIEDIIVITSRSKQSIEDHFDRSAELETALGASLKHDLLQVVGAVSGMANIHFVRQKSPLGLGHAVAQARQHIGDEPFAVLLPDELFAGDEPCLHQLLRRAEERNASMIAVRVVPSEHVSRYGIIEPDQVARRTHRVLSLVEKPERDHAPSNLAVVGRYVLHPDIFDMLATVAPSRNGEIQLTDALRQLARVHPLYGYEVTGRRYDVGDKLGFLQAQVEFALNRDDLAEPFRQYLIDMVGKQEASRAVK